MQAATETFDYIIIGAGSAGCVLANRLSADPAISVCLIEAGKKDNSLMIKMPAGLAELMPNPGEYNWGFSTEPQKHLNNRSIYWPRGKGWGGSSSINGMVHVRGHAGDFDQWQQMGLTGWSYSDVLPYFKKSETCAEGADEFHGESGPLKIGTSPLDNPIYHAFLKAGESAGYAYNADFNGAHQEGFGPFQRTIIHGERSSASSAYLHPIKSRKNLKIVSAGRVKKIIIKECRAVGVEVVKNRSGPTVIITAEREVILSAGAVHSPQILNLSGIGDPQTLGAFGITTKVASSGVGQNLQDHLDLTIVHEMTQPLSAYSASKGFRKILVGLNYLINRKGPGADNFLQAGAFIKTREGLERPNVQLHFVNALLLELGRVPPSKDGFTIHACNLRPLSRGIVKLKSLDVFDAPFIDPNYLAEEDDLRVMREAVKLVRKICAQEAFDRYRGPELMPGEGQQEDVAIDAFIRESSETICHPVGTVAMGAQDRAPLDTQLRVRGLDGLRVVDASVMPTLVGGNTNAATIMIAEKAADMILAS